jgi:hypothetical protein
MTMTLMSCVRKWSWRSSARERRARST